jgi:large subunit ribosomal protein L9
MIKVILKEDVIGQGNKDQVVDVAEGFARNFLLPRAKAVIATPEALKKIEEEKGREQQKEDNIKEKNLALKERIGALELEISKKSEGDKLFGALSGKEISEALEKQGVTIDPKKIKIPEPVKSVGDYKIGIILDRNIKAELKVRVSAEK